MYQETITIDVDRLRDDMRDECLGAYFGGGFGAAHIESFDVDRATPEKLVDFHKTSWQICIFSCSCFCAT